MTRAVTGTVAWRGVPARWWARLTVPDIRTGESRRVWIDLDRPDLKNTIEDKAAAKRIALDLSSSARDKVFVGKDRQADDTISAVRVILSGQLTRTEKYAAVMRLVDSSTPNDCEHADSECPLSCVCPCGLCMACRQRDDGGASGW